MSATLCQTFTLPEDGWFHIATPGEWPHKPTGLLQVLDDDAMQSIVASFDDCSKQSNWPGVLIDFDHQSLDVDKPSVAAGWIVSLEKRPTGIWAQIRWSDLGKKSIEGGRYRFISPVWRSTDCALLGDDRIRPLKLMNCAVTNDPNIKGLFPLSNADTTVPMRFAPPAIPITPPVIPLRMHGDVLLKNAAEFRSGYNPRTDRRLNEEQLKLLHARRGGGGGGGGKSKGGSSGTTPSQPKPASAPSDNSTPRYARDHEGRLKTLEQQRDTLTANAPSAPPPKTTYDQIDVRQIQKDVMKAGGSSTDVINAVNTAKTINAQRKAELDAVKRDIRKQYKSPEAEARALERHMRDIDKEHAKETAAWQRDKTRRDGEVNKIDQQIDEENQRLTESERRADIADAQNEAKARQQAVKDQIAADKEAARKKLAKEREEKKTKEEPVRQYKAELRRRAAYVDALSRGDDFYASQLAPEADHAKMKAAIDAIKSADPDSSDYRKMKIHLDALKSKPLPKRAEE
ncbi:MAG TPA: phage protease [Kiritimatiellia bacterium]|nr:phage protease [Kiritimatiellia bacterium]